MNFKTNQQKTINSIKNYKKNQFSQKHHKTITIK